jgi:hypothetical protein
MISLLQLSTSEDPKRPAADVAILNLQTALNSGKNVRILDKDGTDLTGKALSSGKPLQAEPGTKEAQDDILIGITRRESDMTNRGKPEGVDETAKPAILVTESRTTRIRAKGVGVAAVATSMLRNVLQGSLTRRRSPSGSSMGRHSPTPGSGMNLM